MCSSFHQGRSLLWRRIHPSVSTSRGSVAGRSSRRRDRCDKRQQQRRWQHFRTLLMFSTLVCPDDARWTGGQESFKRSGSTLGGGAAIGVSQSTFARRVTKMAAVFIRRANSSAHNFIHVFCVNLTRQVQEAALIHLDLPWRSPSALHVQIDVYSSQQHNSCQTQRIKISSSCSAHGISRLTVSCCRPRL